MNKILITTIDMHTFNSPLLQLVIIANKGIWKKKNKFILHIMYITSKDIFYRGHP